jgi:hypothetical protein
MRLLKEQSESKIELTAEQKQQLVKNYITMCKEAFNSQFRTEDVYDGMFDDTDDAEVEDKLIELADEFVDKLKLDASPVRKIRGPRSK